MRVKKKNCTNTPQDSMKVWQASRSVDCDVLSKVVIKIRFRIMQVVGVLG